MEIRCSAGTYAVEVAESLAQAVRRTHSGGRPVHILLDATVQRLYPQAWADVKSEFMTAVPATEDQKSFSALEPIFHRIVSAGLKRDGRLVVIGGGVVQDIGCFAASVLYRGIAWEFVPTTLLAQCDSCVGGKSSINLGKLKNQVGTFHPPERVQLAFEALGTLPDDELRSGMGEIIKLYLVDGENSFAALAPKLPQLTRRLDLLPPVILRALEIKKRFIEEDEFDTGIRNLLNYGHTFGHAYEAVTDYRIPHGIAVTLGMVTATFFSEKLGLAPAGHFRELEPLLRPYYAPYPALLGRRSIPGILAAMRSDKKSTSHSSNFILTRGPGKMEKIPLSLDRQVAPVFEEFFTAIGVEG